MTTAQAANRVWYTASLLAWRRYRFALNAPMKAQMRLLKGYVRRNADTAIGRRFGFASIRSIEDFQKRVPLSRYEDYERLINLTGKGASNQITSEPVVRLMPTSGSSGPAKFIPYTARLQAEFNRAIAPWIVDLFRRLPAAMTGPAYWSISPSIHVEENPDWTVPVGFEDDTKYLGACLSRIINQALAVPSCVRHAQDVRLFRYATLAFLLASENLRLISIWHPSFLDLLLEDLPRVMEDVVRSLHDGVLNLPRDVDAIVRRELQAHWSRNPARARELEALGSDRWTQLWPHLAVVSAWGHGASALPWRGLCRKWPSAGHQAKGLVATEAMMTIPFLGSYPLAVNSHFFEFIADDGGIYTCDQLEAGGEYEIVLTTGGGLYRYRIGDRVCVEGTVKSTPSLVFVGRNGLISDLCGEKLSEAFVAKLLRTLIAPYEDVVKSAVLKPEKRDKAFGYCLEVELSQPLPRFAESAAKDLEAALQENPHYALCVRLKQLDPARVRIAAFRNLQREDPVRTKPSSIAPIA